MAHKYKVAIIGAGTAGLTARDEVAKKTDNYVVIDGGPLGTTCARVGCMPSKALIEAANALHEAKRLAEFGHKAVDLFETDPSAVMVRVRRLRDKFASGVRAGMRGWQEKLIRKHARFKTPNTLDLGDETITADRIIIAVGSQPVIPVEWQVQYPQLIDTETFFELETLPVRLAVFGLGPVGAEIGQAAARLGVSVSAVTRNKKIGGLTDPKIQSLALEILSKEMVVHLGDAEIIGETDTGLEIASQNDTLEVDNVLTAMGRSPSLSGLNLKALGVDLDDEGIPRFNDTTLQVGDLPIFMAGDANGASPVLHEAADEGRIAGYNAVSPNPACFLRRTPLAVTFTSPNIAVVGRSHGSLTAEGLDFITGEANFKTNGRARMGLRNHGRIRVYANPSDGGLLGAEMMAPAGEHLAHTLAWAISWGMTARDLLAVPYYHPVLEETLRYAFREIARQVTGKKPEMEMFRCKDAPAG